MKKLALILAFLIGSMASAFAACVGPVVMHDFPGTSFNMSVVTAPTGANDCQSNVALPTWAGGTLGAMANYGTSPGAVLVPGVNAFITNAPAVTQSGTWTVQPGNTANTTAWLVTGTGGVFPSSQSGTWTIQPGNTANTTPWLQSISQGGSTAAVKAANTVATTDVGLVVAVANTLTPGLALPAASSPVVAALPTLAGNATFVSGTTAAMTGTTSTQIIPLVASNRIYVTRIACKGDPTNAVGTRVQIRDGVAGTILDTLTVAPNGGGEQGTGATPLYWTTSGTALYAQNVTTASSVICTASGYSG